MLIQKEDIWIRTEGKGGGKLRFSVFTRDGLIRYKPDFGGYEFLLPHFPNESYFIWTRWDTGYQGVRVFRTNEELLKYAERAFPGLMFQMVENPPGTYFDDLRPYPKFTWGHSTNMRRARHAGLPFFHLVKNEQDKSKNRQA